MASNYVGPGLAAARFAKAIAVAGGDPLAALAYAEGQRHWRASPTVVEHLRSAVEGFSRIDETFNNPIGLDLAAAVRPLSVLGRIPGVLRLPFRVSVTVGTGARGAFVAEGAPIPVSADNFSLPVALEPRRVAALSVYSRDLLARSSDSVETYLQHDLAAACAAALDVALLDPAGDGSGAAPASIVNGATTIASTGSTIAAIDADLAAAVQSLIDAGSDLANVVWILGPGSASFLARLRGTGGVLAYPTMSAKGGMLLGVPAIVSGASPTGDSPPSGQIVLIDGAGLAVADEGGASIDASTDSALQMDDAPTDGAASLVSLYQSNSVAIRATRFIDWRVIRPGSVAVISGVDF